MVRSIPLSKLQAALDRAAKYRRQQSAGLANEFSLQQDIIAVPVPPPLHLNDDGWAKAGVIADPYAPPGYLTVWWKPETDQLRVEKPIPLKDPERPQFLGDPLYRTPTVSSRSAHRPFTAVAGYIYLYQGQRYSPEEAEEITAQLGTLDGWSWIQEK